ncbi:hypothetical protein SUGI_0645200 [Cryptomeria japonica]|nr:hypothetical protein SUGI_0645200 [Cryptomeria japonica]
MDSTFGHAVHLIVFSESSTWLLTESTTFQNVRTYVDICPASQFDNMDLLNPPFSWYFVLPATGSLYSIIFLELFLASTEMITTTIEWVMAEFIRIP